MGELDKVKAGDDLVLYCPSQRLDGYAYSLVKVDRVTATQIIVGESRFTKRTGRRRGGSSAWFVDYLLPATDANMTLVQNSETKRKIYLRRHAIAAELRRDLSLEHLEKILQVCREDE